MAVSPSIRLPCGQTTSSVSLPSLFGCWQSLDNRFVSGSPDSVYVKYNATKMLNYTASDPMWIDPFVIAKGGNLEAQCSPYSSDPPQNFVCGDGINGNVWCWPINDTYIEPSGSQQVGFSIGNFHNVYSQSNDTQSFHQCRQLGFKNLYAHKSWNGRRSYTSRDWQKLDDWDWCCSGCGYHNLDTGSIDDTKYRTVAATSYFNTHTDVYNMSSTDEDSQFCCSDGFNICNCGDEGCGGPVEISCVSFTFDHSTDIGGSADASTTIDIYGNIVAASCDSASNGCTIDICDTQMTNQAVSMLDLANTNYTNLQVQWCHDLAQYEAFVAPDVISHDGPGSWTLEWHVTVTLCNSPCGGALDSTSELAVQMVITPFTYDLYTYGAKPQKDSCNDSTNCRTWVQTKHTHLEYAELSVSYVADLTGIGSISFEQTYHQDVGGSLADPYTISQVKDDMIAMSALWDIGNELVYPWKYKAENSINMGPVIYHDEGTSVIPFVPACVTSSNYTGRIIGAPAPAGIDKVWCVDHPNYCVCSFVDEEAETCYELYIRDYGAWSTDCGTPRATAFLTVPEANNVPQGAFVGSNFFYSSPNTCADQLPTQDHDDIIWMCKYAEVIFPKQSFNYFRPCGADRLQPSSSFASCISGSGSNANVLLLEPSALPTDIQTGDKVYVCGTSTVDGYWTANRDGDYQLTLNEPRIASASQFPTQPLTDCGTGLVYKIRFPDLTNIVCGRLNITNITSGSSGSILTCSLEASTYLVNNDTIALINVSGSPSINNIYSAIVINNYTIGLSGSVGGGAYSGGQMYSSGSPDWMWNDVSAKNDFTIRGWQYDYRGVGEYYRVSASIPADLGYVACGTLFDPCTISPAMPAEPRGHQRECGFDQNIIYSYCSTSCLPFNPCGAVVAYFSPNSESFTGAGQNYWVIPGGFTYGDGNYPTMIQMIPYQSMPDPYFISPPCPCHNVDGVLQCHGTWTEDQGNCTGDYPLRDQFEARCFPPSGSPALHSGVYMGCLVTADFGTGSATGNTGSCPNGNICFPPGQPFATFPEVDGVCGNQALLPNIYDQPWIVLQEREGCVCNDGTFSNEYQANGISAGPNCDPIVPPP